MSSTTMNNAQNSITAALSSFDIIKQVTYVTEEPAAHGYRLGDGGVASSSKLTSTIGMDANMSAELFPLNFVENQSTVNVQNASILQIKEKLALLWTPNSINTIPFNNLIFQAMFILNWEHRQTVGSLRHGVIEFDEYYTKLLKRLSVDKYDQLFVIENKRIFAKNWAKYTLGDNFTNFGLEFVIAEKMFVDKQASRSVGVLSTPVSNSTANKRFGVIPMAASTVAEISTNSTKNTISTDSRWFEIFIPRILVHLHDTNAQKYMAVFETAGHNEFVSMIQGAGSLIEITPAADSVGSIMEKIRDYVNRMSRLFAHSQVADVSRASGQLSPTSANFPVSLEAEFIVELYTEMRSLVGYPQDFVVTFLATMINTIEERTKNTHHRIVDYNTYYSVLLSSATQDPKTVPGYVGQTNDSNMPNSPIIYYYKHVVAIGTWTKINIHVVVKKDDSIISQQNYTITVPKFGLPLNVRINERIAMLTNQEAQNNTQISYIDHSNALGMNSERTQLMVQNGANAEERKHLEFFKSSQMRRLLVQTNIKTISGLIAKHETSNHAKVTRFIQAVTFICAHVEMSIRRMSNSEFIAAYSSIQGVGTVWWQSFYDYVADNCEVVLHTVTWSTDRAYLEESVIIDIVKYYGKINEFIRGLLSTEAMPLLGSATPTGADASTSPVTPVVQTPVAGNRQNRAATMSFLGDITVRGSKINPFIGILPANVKMLKFEILQLCNDISGILQKTIDTNERVNQPAFSNLENLLKYAITDAYYIDLRAGQSRVLSEYITEWIEKYRYSLQYSSFREAIYSTIERDINDAYPIESLRVIQQHRATLGFSDYRFDGTSLVEFQKNRRRALEYIRQILNLRNFENTAGTGKLVSGHFFNYCVGLRPTNLCMWSVVGHGRIQFGRLVAGSTGIRQNEFNTDIIYTINMQIAALNSIRKTLQSMVNVYEILEKSPNKLVAEHAIGANLVPPTPIAPYAFQEEYLVNFLNILRGAVRSDEETKFKEDIEVSKMSNAIYRYNIYNGKYRSSNRFREFYNTNGVLRTEAEILQIFNAFDSLDPHKYQIDEAYMNNLAAKLGFNATEIVNALQLFIPATKILEKYFAFNQPTRVWTCRDENCKATFVDGNPSERVEHLEQKHPISHAEFIRNFDALKNEGAKSHPIMIPGKMMTEFHSYIRQRTTMVPTVENLEHLDSQIEIMQRITSDGQKKSFHDVFVRDLLAMKSKAHYSYPFSTSRHDRAGFLDLARSVDSCDPDHASFISLYFKLLGYMDMTYSKLWDLYRKYHVDDVGRLFLQNMFGIINDVINSGGFRNSTMSVADLIKMFGYRYQNIGDQSVPQYANSYLYFKNLGISMHELKHIALHSFDLRRDYVTLPNNVKTFYEAYGAAMKQAFDLINESLSITEKVKLLVQTHRELLSPRYSGAGNSELDSYLEQKVYRNLMYALFSFSDFKTMDRETVKKYTDTVSTPGKPITITLIACHLGKLLREFFVDEDPSAKLPLAIELAVEAIIKNIDSMITRATMAKQTITTLVRDFYLSTAENAAASPSKLSEIESAVESVFANLREICYLGSRDNINLLMHPDIKNVLLRSKSHIDIWENSQKLDVFIASCGKIDGELSINRILERIDTSVRNIFGRSSDDMQMLFGDLSDYFVNKYEADRIISMFSTLCKIGSVDDSIQKIIIPSKVVLFDDADTTEEVGSSDSEDDEEFVLPSEPELSYVLPSLYVIQSLLEGRLSVKIPRNVVDFCNTRLLEAKSDFFNKIQQKTDFFSYFDSENGSPAIVMPSYSILSIAELMYPNAKTDMQMPNLRVKDVTATCHSCGATFAVSRMNIGHFLVSGASTMDVSDTAIQFPGIVCTTPNCTGLASIDARVSQISGYGEYVMIMNNCTQEVTVPETINIGGTTYTKFVGLLQDTPIDKSSPVSSPVFASSSSSTGSDSKLGDSVIESCSYSFVRWERDGTVFCSKFAPDSVLDTEFESDEDFVTECLESKTSKNTVHLVIYKKSYSVRATTETKIAKSTKNTRFIESFDNNSEIIRFSQNAATIGDMLKLVKKNWDYYACYVMFEQERILSQFCSNYRITPSMAKNSSTVVELIGGGRTMNERDITHQNINRISINIAYVEGMTNTGKSDLAMMSAVLISKFKQYYLNIDSMMRLNFQLIYVCRSSLLRKQLYGKFESNACLHGIRAGYYDKKTMTIQINKNTTFKKVSVSATKDYGNADDDLRSASTHSAKETSAFRMRKAKNKPSKKNTILADAINLTNLDILFLDADDAIGYIKVENYNIKKFLWIDEFLPRIGEYNGIGAIETAQFGRETLRKYALELYFLLRPMPFTTFSGSTMIEQSTVRDIITKSPLFNENTMMIGTISRYDSKAIHVPSQMQLTSGDAFTPCTFVDEAAIDSVVQSLYHSPILRRFVYFTSSNLALAALKTCKSKVPRGMSVIDHVDNVLRTNPNDAESRILLAGSAISQTYDHMDSDSIIENILFTSIYVPYMLTRRMVGVSIPPADIPTADILSSFNLSRGDVVDPLLAPFYVGSVLPIFRDTKTFNAERLSKLTRHMEFGTGHGWIGSPCSDRINELFGINSFPPNLVSKYIVADSLSNEQKTKKKSVGVASAGPLGKQNETVQSKSVYSKINIGDRIRKFHINAAHTNNRLILFTEEPLEIAQYVLEVIIGTDFRKYQTGKMTDMYKTYIENQSNRDSADEAKARQARELDSQKTVKSKAGKDRQKDSEDSAGGDPGQQGHNRNELIDQKTANEQTEINVYTKSNAFVSTGNSYATILNKFPHLVNHPLELALLGNGIFYSSGNINSPMTEEIYNYCVQSVAQIKIRIIIFNSVGAYGMNIANATEAYILDSFVCENGFNTTLQASSRTGRRSLSDTACTVFEPLGAFAMSQFFIFKKNANGENKGSSIRIFSILALLSGEMELVSRDYTTNDIVLLREKIAEYQYTSTRDLYQFDYFSNLAMQICAIELFFIRSIDRLGIFYRAIEFYYRRNMLYQDKARLADRIIQQNEDIITAATDEVKFSDIKCYDSITREIESTTPEGVVKTKVTTEIEIQISEKLLNILTYELVIFFASRFHQTNEESNCSFYNDLLKGKTNGSQYEFNILAADCHFNPRNIQ